MTVVGSARSLPPLNRREIRQKSRHFISLFLRTLTVTYILTTVSVPIPYEVLRDVDANQYPRPRILANRRSDCTGSRVE